MLLLSSVYSDLPYRKDEYFLDEISRANSFMEEGQACVFESPVVCDFSSHHFPPRPESTMQNNPSFYVPACAGEKGGHHFGGTFLSS